MFGLVPVMACQGEHAADEEAEEDPPGLVQRQPAPDDISGI